MFAAAIDLHSRDASTSLSLSLLTSLERVTDERRATAVLAVTHWHGMPIRVEQERTRDAVERNE